MTTETFEIDTLVQLSVAFSALPSGAATDPTTVTLYVRNPAGQVADYTGGQLNKAGTGQYNASVSLNASGYWSYKWQGTGALEITTPDVALYVAPSALIPG